ncbi:hypothetical protein IHE45_05G006700 [Dioscorea alata]|uniref:Uncharacterized protein n=1 Tax=Dioscorea alata TaxID=55571 RepID=A0ACB7VZR1_DIOAL|nr:hypothetical protein IHE45_05G006700 [Dioscorea alata]
MAIQQYPSCEPLSQSYEGIGSRVGPLNRIVGNDKVDANPPLSSHSTEVISRNDTYGLSLPNERMDGSTDLLEDQIITKGKHRAGLDGIVGSNEMIVNSLLGSDCAQITPRNDLDGISLSNERRDHNNSLQKIAASSNRIIGSDTMDVNSLQSSGSAQVKPRFDMGGISIAKEGMESASGPQEELIITEQKHNLNIQEEVRMGSQCTSIEINTSGIPMTGVLLNSSVNFQQPLENVAGDQLPSSNEVLALPGALNHELPLPEWSGSCPIAWKQLCSSNEVQALSGTINHMHPLLTGSPLSPISWSQLPSSNKVIGSAPCPTAQEQLPSSNEVQSLPWTVNNKRPLPVECDSYPVAQCIVHHPLKTCCARRANVLSPGSSLDDSSILADGFPGADSGTRLEPTESSGGTLLSLDLYNTPHLKLQAGEIPSLAGFLKSEELGAADGGNDKSVDDEARKGDLNSVDRVASTVFPARKNVSSKSEIGDGILRQAKSGRCPKRLKAHLSFVKELDHEETSRLPKSQRSCSNKNESNIGHASKMSHCKAYGHSDKSNADKQELIAAANAARNASCAACSSNFWKTVEPIFSFADPEDINYVMQQDVDGCAEMPLPKGSFSTKLQGSRRSKDDNNKDVDSVFSDTAEDDHKESDHSKSVSKVESAFGSQKCTAAIHFGNLNAQNLVFGDDLGHENITSEHLDNVLSQNLSRTSSDCRQNLGADFSAVSSGCCDEGMPLNENVLMEQSSIDIHPETRKGLSEEDDSEIDMDLAELKLRLYEQVNYRRRQWNKIEKAMQNAKEIKDRNLEQLALDKLVEMAYQKLMCGRSHNMGARNLSKQSAIAFAKRTLERCKEFDETGISCFSEPALREILFSAPPHCSNVSHVALDKGQALGSVGNGLSNKCHRGSLDLCQRSAQVKLLSGNTAHNLSRNSEDELLLNAADSMEILDIADGLGAPGQDIGSWLNIDEDLLDDNEELVGLDVPMDDLSELNVIF